MIAIRVVTETDQRFNGARWLLRALVALLLFAASQQMLHAQVPAPLEAVRIQQRPGKQVPRELHFRDETGREVELRDYFGKRPIILVLAYNRCPRLCSQVLNGLSESLRVVPFELGKDYSIITVSIDPREQPDLAAAKRKTYLEHLGMPKSNDWHFLTGGQQEIDRLAGVVGFRYLYDERRDEYQHAAGIMVLTPQGKTARYLFGANFSPRDVRLALAEAGEGKIAAPVENALLFACMTFDPDKGQYTWAAFKLLRFGAVVTVVIIGGYLAWNWIRETRAARLSQTVNKIADASVAPQ